MYEVNRDKVAVAFNICGLKRDEAEDDGKNTEILRKAVVTWLDGSLFFLWSYCCFSLYFTLSKSVLLQRIKYEGILKFEHMTASLRWKYSIRYKVLVF